MSDRFPAVEARQVIRIAKELGFVKVRETGSSHAIYKRESDKRRVVIPRHRKTTIKRRTLKSILIQLGISVEEFKQRL